MITNKRKETEIDDDHSWKLLSILKSFVRIRENSVVKADFQKNEIRFEYYYNDIDDFSSEKEVNYLNKFVKVAKFNQKNGINL